MSRIRAFRWMSLLTVLALLLVSCAPADTAPEVDEPADEDVAPEVEVVTLRVWDFGGDEFEWIDSLIKPAFEEEHPNIVIEHLGVPESDYSTKLETSIAAGEPPDVALQSYTYRLWPAGHVAVLDDWFEADGFQDDDFYPIFQSWCMLEGKVYCMPGAGYIWGMIYNKDLFEEAGLPMLGPDDVITYDDWLEYARAINKPAENLEDRVWGSSHFTPNWNAMNNYMDEPYMLGQDGRTCEGNAETDDWVRTWTDMVASYDEDLTTATGSALMGELGNNDLFNQGKIGMKYGTYGNALEAQKAGINVGLAGQPVVTPGWRGNVGAWSTGYGMMSATEYPDEAWEFLKFLTVTGSKLFAEGDCVGCGNPSTYKPAGEGWAGDDPLKQDAVALMARMVPPPFSPDIWTSNDPFYEAWRRMTEDGTPVEEAVHDAAVECQEITDDLWTEWDLLSE